MALASSFKSWPFSQHFTVLVFPASITRERLSKSFYVKTKKCLISNFNIDKAQYTSTSIFFNFSPTMCDKLKFISCTYAYNKCLYPYPLLMLEWMNTRANLFGNETNAFAQGDQLLANRKISQFTVTIDNLI